MQFRAEEYYQAAQERMLQAVKVYREERSYALAMYCGGLAVECLLRAFRWTNNPTFDGRHDLSDLLKASRLLQIADDEILQKPKQEERIRDANLKLRVAMQEVVMLWHNSLRFSSEARLKSFLKSLDRLRGIKGDPLKKNALDLIEAAQTVVDRGVLLWTLRKK